MTTLQLITTVQRALLAPTLSAYAMAVKEGWLLKRGPSVESAWLPQWCVLASKSRQQDVSMSPVQRKLVFEWWLILSKSSFGEENVRITFLFDSVCWFTSEGIEVCHLYSSTQVPGFFSGAGPQWLQVLRGSLGARHGPGGETRDALMCWGVALSKWPFWGWFRNSFFMDLLI